MTTEIAAGTWVQMKGSARGWGRYGRVLADPRRVDGYGVITDSSRNVGCVRENFAVSRDQRPPHPWFPMRKTLPYGRYIVGDGTFVFFNRDYQPIVKVESDGTRLPCCRHSWVAHERSAWFYDECCLPWERPSIKARLIEILDGRPISEDDIVYRFDDKRTARRPDWYPRWA
jgi:hypothetical protein